eukprot:gene2408-2712_t
MVQVYQQPLCKRHHTGFLSSAVLYRAASCLAAVTLSFLLPYATGGFWKKVALDTVQPAVHYTGDALMVLEVGQEDWNLDGKADLLRFVAEVQSPIDVHSLKLVLQLSYALQGAARLKMYSLAYITAASPLPGSSFSADGQVRQVQVGQSSEKAIADHFLLPLLLLSCVTIADISRLQMASQKLSTTTNQLSTLLLQQLAPLPTSTVSLGLDKPLMGSSSGYRVQARNITTRYDNQYPVWKAGNSRRFVVDVKIRIPPHQVHLYRPSTSEMLKWGWVQFAATFWVVWWLLSWIEGLVFQFRMLETRVISDIQPRQQKY